MPLSTAKIKLPTTDQSTGRVLRVIERNEDNLICVTRDGYVVVPMEFVERVEAA